MHLRLHLPSLSDVPNHGSLRQQRRLQQVIAQSFERAVTIVGLTHAQIEIVRDGTMEISRSDASAAVGDRFHRGQSQRDWFHHGRFPDVAVLQHGESGYIYAGGSPYVEAKNLARALRWGAVLFGRSGYVVLQPKGASPANQFYVVQLVRRADQGSSAGVNASILPLQDYVTVTVVDRKGQAYFRKRAHDPWTFAQVKQTLANIPVEQSTIDLSTIHFIVMMDCTIFAEIPWEKRAEYLELLLQAWTGQREKHAILEIIHSTRTSAELEAIFALLRERGKYEQFFADLDEQLYQLLQFLAGFVPDHPIDWHYLVALLSDMKILPDEIFNRADAPAEFLWVVESARQGNLQAQKFVRRMLTQAGAASIRALLGLQYAEELGTPYDQRERATSFGETLRRQLERMLICDLLAWFASLNEFRQAPEEIENWPERLAHLTHVLSSQQVQELDISGLAPSIIELLEAYTASTGGMTVQMAEGLQALLGCPSWDQDKLHDLIENIPPANLHAFLHTMTFISPFSLETWEVGMLKELALHPAALASIREAGSDLMVTTFKHVGNSWETFEIFLEKLAAKRIRTGHPIDYQWFLQRMRMGEATAFAEVMEGEI